MRILKFWLPVLLWMSIIFYFSSNPDPYKYLPESWRSLVPLREINDSSLSEWVGQLMYFVEYAILALLIARAFHLTKPNYPKITLLTIMFSMIYAFSDEIHQLFVPGRAFQVLDLLIDLLGVLCGVYLYARFKYGTTKTQRSQSFLWGLF